MQKVFWAQGAKVSQESFAPPKPCFAPVQLSFAPVQEAFGTLAPKDLLHPLLTTFGNFEVSGRCSRTFGLQLWHSKNNPNFRQEKRAQRLSFWVRRPPGGVGVFHAKGWWPKTSCPPSKLDLPWVSKRGIRDVPGILPGCPGPLAVFKKFVQKKLRAHFSFPIIQQPQSITRRA